MSGQSPSDPTSPLICPVCRGTMQELTKAGIVIDTCTQCRGVWLDRGELEKLASALGPQGAMSGREMPPRGRHLNDGYRDWEGDDDDDDRRRRGPGGERSKSKLSRLMDFFD